MIKPYKLDTNNHSAFRLHYHLILTIKYRRKIITKTIEKELIQHFEKIAPDYHITLDETKSDKDHIHFLFSAWPNTQLSKFINAYKAATSRVLKTKHPEIKEKLWQERVWSGSYCLLTTGGTTIDVIRKYIESQGEPK